MHLELPDNIVRDAGLTEGELRLELACRLFDAGRLTLGQGARMAGMGPDAFEDALVERDIDLNRFQLEDIRREIADVKAMCTRKSD